jgi:hypothetical protein
VGRDIDGEAEGDLTGCQYPYHQMELVRLAHQIMMNGRDSGHVRIYEYRNDGWFQLVGT